VLYGPLARSEGKRWGSLNGRARAGALGEMLSRPPNGEEGRGPPRRLRLGALEVEQVQGSVRRWWQSRRTVTGFLARVGRFSPLSGGRFPQGAVRRPARPTGGRGTGR
jgi:hypothetical protein